MTAPLGFLIVGCGTIARFHVRALADIPGTRVAALVGRTLDAPNRLATEMGLTGIGVFSDLAIALRQTGIDAVIVCTPSGNHLEAAILAAQAGKHVVVEKPLEITPDRCDRIIDACDQAGVQLCTIFPSRFHETNRAIKSAIDTGRFGRIAIAETTCKWWRSQEYYDSGAWRGTWTLDGGGALMNQAIHNVDVLLWLMGPATHVSGFTATLAHDRIEIEDTCVASIRFASGALGTIIAATSAYPGVPKTLAIHGDRGSVMTENDRLLHWQFADEHPEDAGLRERLGRKVDGSTGSSDPKAISHEGHARQLIDFVEAIRGSRPPAIDGREGRKSVQLIHAIYEASRTGRVVAL